MSESRIFNIKEYFKLSKVFQKILRYLAYMEANHKKVFPSIDHISRICQCSERQVQRCIAALSNVFLKVRRRFRPNKSQASNLYEVDKDMFKAIQDLDQRNLLDKGRDMYASIIEEFEKRFRKCHPPSPPKCHPPIDSSLNIPHEEYIHPKIQGLGISQKDKELLSKYPERAIMMCLEDVRWYLKQKKEIRSPMGFLLDRIRSYC